MLLILYHRCQEFLQSARVQGERLLTFFSATCFLYCIKFLVFTSLLQECRASTECTDRWLP